MVEAYLYEIKRLKTWLAISATVALIFMVSTIVLYSANVKLSIEVDSLIDQNQQAHYNNALLASQYALQSETHKKELIDLETIVSAKYIDALHMTIDYQDMAATVQAEAGGQGVIGLEHVASVIVNRVNTEHWGTTIHDVISAPGQFTAYGVEVGDIHEDVIVAMDNILINGPINDAIFYMNPDNSAPSSRSWMRTKPYELTYRDHEFYGP